MIRPVHLLDSSVLIAFSTVDHTSHRRVRSWFSGQRLIATCPITQGALVRHWLRSEAGADGFRMGIEMIRMFESMDNHEFWPDDLPYSAVPARGIRGHHQVTDSYLAALARSKGGKLVTLDEALSVWHPDVCVLIPR